MLTGFGSFGGAVHSGYTDGLKYLLDWKWWYIVPAVVLSIFGLASLLLGLLGLYAWLTGYRVPTNLVVMGHGKLTLGQRMRLYFGPVAAVALTVRSPELGRPSLTELLPRNNPNRGDDSSSNLRGSKWPAF
jgi:hypothetical protein